MHTFYSSFSHTPFPISDLSHRHIRFEKDGYFFKLDRAHDHHSLICELLTIAPQNAYYSVSRWMNPHLLVPKEQSVSITDNLFLGCDLVFDVDVKPFSEANIERARQHTIKLYDHLKGRFVLSYAALSGGKGFHLVFKDPVTYKESHPLKREEEAKEFRKFLVETLNDFEFDRKVTTDTRRIIRIPGTINSKTGYQCRTLLEEELRSSAREILKNTLRVTTPALETVQTAFASAWDDLCSFACNPRTTPTAAPSRAGPAFSDALIVSSFQPPVCRFESYLSSSVLGAKNRHIPIITLADTPRAKQAFLQIQKEFGLGPMYLFSSGARLTAITCDALQRERIEKILRRARSQSLLTYKKYLQNFLPVDSLLIETLTAQSRHQESRGHRRFLAARGVDLLPAAQCGSDDYKIVDVVLEP